MKTQDANLATAKALENSFASIQSSPNQTVSLLVHHHSKPQDTCRHTNLRIY